jgi:hypothetical protein
LDFSSLFGAGEEKSAVKHEAISENESEGGNVVQECAEKKNQSVLCHWWERVKDIGESGRGREKCDGQRARRALRRQRG